MKQFVAILTILGFVVLQVACSCGDVSQIGSLGLAVTDVDGSDAVDHHDCDCPSHHSEPSGSSESGSNDHSHHHHKCLGTHLFAASVARSDFQLDEFVAWMTPLSFETTEVLPLDLTSVSPLFEQCAPVPTLPVRAELQVFLI